MKSKFFRYLSGVVFVLSWMCLTTQVQGQEPPHIVIEKVVDSMGIHCPDTVVHVHITLFGDGSAGYIREPLDAVCVIDKSGSMRWGGECCYNVNAEPPYGPLTSAGPCPPPWNGGGTDHHWYVDAKWAAWKFYQYLVDVPPSIGYEDYAGLVFYGSNNYGAGVPGDHAVLTPAPVQGSDPKLFWWNTHLAAQTVGGATAMGPGMQVAKDILVAMPTHPAPTPNPTYPTPPTPYYDVTGDRYMVVLTDGHANNYWTPHPGTPPPLWNDPISHCIEMARRCSLSAPWPEGGYTEHDDITIYSIGLGPGVDAGFLQEVADPFNPAFLYGTPTPEHAHHGSFHWAQTEDDLIEVFQEIASLITNDRAGKDIEIHENWGNGTCGGGEQLYTNIVPGSWNIEPTIIPGPPQEYIWSFDELLVDHEITLTFDIAIDPSAPTEASTLLECPDSHVDYISYHGYNESQLIPDPGIYISDCTTPTPMGSPTITPTPSPTQTPTCQVAAFFDEGFETGDFTLWEDSGPSNMVQVLNDDEYAFDGDACAYFAGADEDLGTHEAHLIKTLNFRDPMRQGPAILFYMKMRNFVWPNKKDGAKDTQGDHFWLYVNSPGSGIDPVVVEYTASDQFIHGDGVWFQQIVDLSQFSGQETVNIQFVSYYPVTNQVVEPDDDYEPMVFLDNISVEDFCYDGTPTPTNTPKPVPSSSPTSITFLLILLSAALVIPILKRR